MRILVINPNTNVETTERIRSISQDAASDGTIIEAVTAPRGANIIKTLEELTFAEEVTLSVLAERVNQFDAVMIGAFGDPGLRQAKKVVQVPVAGIGEASMLAAAAEGERFSIVTMGEAMKGYLRERAREYGVGENLADIRTLPWSVREPTAENFDVLAGECLDTLKRDGANAVVIGGGPLAGFAQQIAERVGAPVLDGTVCAVHLLESRVETGLNVRTTD